MTYKPTPLDREVQEHICRSVLRSRFSAQVYTDKFLEQSPKGNGSLAQLLTFSNRRNWIHFLRGKAVS
jgi:hypothetical protein